MERVCVVLLGGCCPLYFIAQLTFVPLPCPHSGHSGPESSLCSLSLLAPGKPGEVGTGEIIAGQFCGPALDAGETRAPLCRASSAYPVFLLGRDFATTYLESHHQPLHHQACMALNLHSHIPILATFFSPAQWGQSMGWPHLALCFYCTWSGSSLCLQGHPCPIPSRGRAYLSFNIWLQPPLQNVHNVPNPECSQPLAQPFGTCSFSALRDIFPFSCKLD